MKKQTKIILIAAVIVIAGLIALGRMNQPVAATWMDTDVECLPFGHQSLALHIHPVLTMSVDGVAEPVPANVGITDTCMAEVHTHDSTGKIHVETTDRSRTFTLNDFFEVWGEPLEREGYDVRAVVDGGRVDENVGEIELRDLQQIELTYTSRENTETAEEGGLQQEEGGQSTSSPSMEE